MKDHSHIDSHGTVDNKELRLALREANIFAYPSIWPETSCLCLMEAMTEQLLCVHSSYAALPETAGGYTRMYPFTENRDQHVDVFTAKLKQAIIDSHERYDAGSTAVNEQIFARQHAYNNFMWSRRIPQWEQFIKEVKDGNSN